VTAEQKREQRLQLLDDHIDRSLAAGAAPARCRILAGG